MSSYVIERFYEIFAEIQLEALRPRRQDSTVVVFDAKNMRNRLRVKIKKQRYMRHKRLMIETPNLS